MTTSYGELSQRKVQAGGFYSAAPQAGATAQAASTRPSANGRPQYANKIERVQAMEAAAVAGDWELFKSFLADDVYFRVGNVAELGGPQAVGDFMSKMMADQLTINNLKISGAWEVGDAVIMEFVISGFRHDINQQIDLPCLDIYRFRDDKIRDWRVFAIVPIFIE